MAKDFGDALTHLHLADGSGSAKDEHLIPGRGNQACGGPEHLARRNFDGTVVIEASTRQGRARSRSGRGFGVRLLQLVAT